MVVVNELADSIACSWLSLGVLCASIGIVSFSYGVSDGCRRQRTGRIVNQVDELVLVIQRLPLILIQC